MTLSPEESWLVLLADPKGLNQPLPSSRLEARGLIPLCNLAYQHGVLPVVLTHLDAMLHSDPGSILVSASDAPKALDIMIPVRNRVKERIALNLFLTVEARRLQRELAIEGAEALLLKGADFAHRLYSTSTFRAFVDIDLLIRPEDWSIVAATLTRLGYREHEVSMKYSSGYSERTWEHPAMPGAMVEVHDDLVNSPTLRRGVSVKLEDLPTEIASFGPRQATPAGLLLIACVHAAVSHSFDKLQHLCDIAQAARGQAGPVDADALRICTEQTHAGFCLAMGLDLAARTLKEPLCKEWVTRLGLNPPNRLLRCLVTPSLVVRAQGKGRRFGTWRRQILRQMLKTRR
ncbi:MAG: nucleotidyltransferase family protein [Proteobacteria bacterium]|nr:nucleotidyltransferase family protein [Pseudomonadota bacterium]MBU4471459.1 nucleotidyltransferase family protein [Pseudomonadota bacterium]MCG2752465.1 nucleotidyltransferase family protein [Desulfobacteraceae bacterium]